MVAAGESEISAVAVVAEKLDICPPCGGCRQRLKEFAAPTTPVYLGRPGGPDRDHHRGRAAAAGLRRGVAGVSAAEAAAVLRSHLAPRGGHRPGLRPGRRRRRGAGRGQHRLRRAARLPAPDRPRPRRPRGPRAPQRRARVRAHGPRAPLRGRRSRAAHHARARPRRRRRRGARAHQRRRARCAPRSAPGG
jgi:hypothetical protein